jgi:Arginine-tRNA-protein transferase, C terminus
VVEFAAEVANWLALLLSAHQLDWSSGRGRLPVWVIRKLSTLWGLSSPAVGSDPKIFRSFDIAFSPVVLFGSFVILDHIEKARRLGLPHVYLGYWVEGSKKMGYKAAYLPQERLGLHGWSRVER